MYLKSRSNFTAWKVSRYGVFSGSYFPVLGLNTEKKILNPDKMSNVYKVYNKDTRASTTDVVLVILFLTLNIFTSCSSISIKILSNCGMSETHIITRAFRCPLIH